MHLRYVFSETRTGLRRNVSMSIALVVTIFVSLTLVGMGLLLNSQAEKAEAFWGDKLQITVFMCNANSQVATCDGEVTAAEKATIEATIADSPEVASFYFQGKEQAFATWRDVYLSKESQDREIYSTVTAKDMQGSYWIKLKDPEEFQGIKSALAEQQGVAAVRDLREVLKPIYFWMTVMKWGAIAVAGFLLVAAVMQVGNTIRMAAFARRKEIGIMRLVGASTLYIALPFLLEAVVTAAIGIVLAGGALAAFMRFGIHDRVAPSLQFMPWVGLPDLSVSLVVVAILAPALTLVPTLLLTGKYLKV